MAQINSSNASSQLSFLQRNRGVIFQATLLMILWLILSGRFYLEPVVYGLFSVALVVWLNLKVRDIPLKNGEILTGNSIYFFRLLKYLPWLLWQITKSACLVAYLTLHPNMPVNPMIVRFKSMLPNSIAKVILGNSITLTPGTLTLDIYGDDFTVHAIVDRVEQDLVSGDMECRVGRLYLEDCTRDEMCCDISVIKVHKEAHKAVEHKEEDID